jgi:hypothetical protein
MDLYEIVILLSWVGERWRSMRSPSSNYAISEIVFSLSAEVLFTQA